MEAAAFGRELRNALAGLGPSEEPEGPAGGDELRELAVTFRQTVERLAAAMRDLETAHRAALQAEVEKKQFYREVIRAVTLGKFELVDRSELPELGTPLAEIPIDDGAGYPVARKALKEAALQLGMDEARISDFLLAAGEAITNAMKHGRDGCSLLYANPECVVLRVLDHGAGIQAHDIPAVILRSGFSTKVSLGMGYTLMLRLCDRVWLATDSEGTVVQLEKRVAAPPEENGFPEWILERFKPPQPNGAAATEGDNAEGRERG